jgi:hypothetical protein
MQMPVRAKSLAVLAVLLVSWSVRAQDRDEAWVAKQVKQIRQSDTTGWDRISWVGTLTEARRISGSENKPLFLFTLDGNLETGRC